jgi:hypothetical protein
MRNVKDLSLDEQKKRNLILKELNSLASAHDPVSLGRKATLMQSYISLMGITPEDKMVWEEWWRKIRAAKDAQRQAWWTQRAKAKAQI